MKTAKKFALALLAFFLATDTGSASTASGPPNLERLNQQISESNAGHWLQEGENIDVTIIGSAERRSIVAISINEDDDWTGVRFVGNSVIKHAIILVPPGHALEVAAESTMLMEDVQIVGKGPESRSIGLFVADAVTMDGGIAKSGASVTLRDVVLAGHKTALWIKTGSDSPDRPGGTLNATDLYVTNNNDGVVVGGSTKLPELYGNVTMRNAYIWDNVRDDLYASGGMHVNIADSWIPDEPSLEGFSPAPINLDDGSSLMITNTVLHEILVPWLFSNVSNGQNTIWGRDQIRIVNDGPLGEITFWPRIEPRIPQDFTDDGKVDVVDLRHLAENFGQQADQVRSGLVLDLDRSGALDTEDMVQFAYAYAGLATDQPMETLLATPQLQSLSILLVQEYRGVAVELSSDTRFGKFFQNYLDDFPTAVAEIAGKTPPSAFSLGANYPNPFNSGTVIQYQIAEPAEVSVVVYDMLGRTVATLVSVYQTPGTYKITWDGLGDRGQILASGIYFYRIRAGEFDRVQKMTLLR